MTLRSEKALIVLVALASTFLTGDIRAFQNIADMRVDDFQRLGKTEDGGAQVRYLSAVAGEFAQQYDAATAKSIKDFFNVPHGRTYGDGVYALVAYIKNNVKPEEEHRKSIKGIVDLLIETKFGLPKKVK